MQTSPILIYSFSYAMVFILSWISKKDGNYRLINDRGAITDKPGNVTGFHIIGILWLGLVPAFLLKQPVLKILTGSNAPDNSLLVIFSGLLILIAALAIKASKKVIQHVDYLNQNNYQLSTFYICRYFIIRLVFLFTYEMFFRGFLLSGSIKAMGIPLAVSLNVLLYVLLHLFNSRKEMLVCIPFGLLLCWLCILFNAAWPAVILHTCFSLIYEIRIYQSHFIIPKLVRS
jgi:membrane protease YdiL (CAAX protease family)